MKLAIVGSRSFNDYTKLCETLNGFTDITEIISGGAKGADTLAERWAKENNLKLTIFYPDWNKYGKSAGMIRNKSIIDSANEVVAFWDGISRGTENSIQRARSSGKPVTIIYF